jgi:hypothetical protein
MTPLPVLIYMVSLIRRTHSYLSAKHTHPRSEHSRANVLCSFEWVAVVESKAFMEGERTFVKTRRHMQHL